MKILLLSNLYPPYYIGGHEIYMKVIADGLSLKGHDIFVLTSKYGLSRKKGNDEIFRILHHFKNNKGFGKRYGQVSRGLLGRLNYILTRKLIESLKVDIVYAGQLEGISVYPLKAIQRKGIPIVHHLGQYDFPELVKMCVLEQNPIKRFYRKAIYGFGSLDEFDFRYVITLTEAVKKKYTEVGFPESNISVIPPLGIPSELIKCESTISSAGQNRTVKLLYVGRLVRAKGVHVAIESVRVLATNFGRINVSLDIIGDGDSEYIEYLNNLVREQNLTKCVHFRNKLPREQVLKEYSNYDVLLVPSLWEEPFGIIILEAMSQGVPVVASRVGGISEIIEDENVGILVPANDPLRMAEAVNKLIVNSSLANKIALNGIELIKKKYTAKNIIDQIETYFIRVITNMK